MDEKKSPFSSEYITTEETDDSEFVDEFSTESSIKQSGQIVPDTKKYGISKPIRIIIRGTITK